MKIEIVPLDEREPLADFDRNVIKYLEKNKKGKNIVFTPKLFFDIIYEDADDTLVFLFYNIIDKEKDIAKEEQIDKHEAIMYMNLYLKENNIKNKSVRVDTINIVRLDDKNYLVRYHTNSIGIEKGKYNAKD